MTFAIGIFDLFTYTISGSIYLAFLGYLVVRLHWVDIGALAGTPVPTLIVFVLLSYLLGYVAYPVGAVVNRVVPRRRERHPRQEFLRRVPTAQDRDYVQADPFLLLSALQLHDKDAAAEVTRLRASGLMLRNCAPPLALGFVAAIVELFLSRTPAMAAGCAVLLAVGFFSLIVQARRLSHWARMKTLELCFWLPDIDERYRVDRNAGGGSSPNNE
ncbi:hypothetical protein AB0F15_10165 [Amycolatopsis sp. NPDC026612]|uniref:hypothetical protein n=1 Tax=Amycolatopsis sp. NPDC026612 TaxID=3155466 RepID=UPI003404A34B